MNQNNSDSGQCLIQTMNIGTKPWILTSKRYDGYRRDFNVGVPLPMTRTQ